MKNQYSKFVKHLEKAQKVMFQHDVDNVYITDGYVAVRISNVIYKALLRPLSGMFLDTDKSCKATKLRDDAMLHTTGNDIEIKQLLEGMLDGVSEIVCSKFSIDVPTNKSKPDTARIFFKNGKIIKAINNMYIQMFDDIIRYSNGGWYSSDTEKSAIIYRSNEVDIIIMPMILKKEEFKVWKPIFSNE